MKKMSLHIALAWVSLMLPFASNASEITVLGGINLSSPSLKYTSSAVSTSTKSDIAMAGGVLIAVPIAMNTIAFETGALYKQEKGTITVTGSGVTIPVKQETKRLQIPLLFRFIQLPIVSFGLGGYWETGIGGVKQTTGGKTTDSSYGSTGVYAPDYGLLGDIRFTMPVAPTIGIVLDANYSFGLAERSSNKSSYSYKSKALAALAGVRIKL